MLKFSFLLILISLSDQCLSKVEVKYLNQRYMWIKASSQVVKASLTKPVEGLSICSIDIKSDGQFFSFVTRRAVAYDECLHIVLKARALIKSSKFIEVIGSSSTKDYIPSSYISLFELIRAGKKCVGYFGDCENFEKENSDFSEWNMKAIDPDIYP